MFFRRSENDGLSDKLTAQLFQMQFRLGNDAPDGIMASFVQERLPDGGVRVYNTNPE